MLAFLFNQNVVYLFILLFEKKQYIIIIIYIFLLNSFEIIMVRIAENSSFSLFFLSKTSLPFIFLFTNKCRLLCIIQINFFSWILLFYQKEFTINIYITSKYFILFIMNISGMKCEWKIKYKTPKICNWIVIPIWTSVIFILLSLLKT